MPELDHEALVQSLPRIAEVVNLFKSEAVQASAFELLVASLGVAVPAMRPDDTNRIRQRSARKSSSTTRSAKRSTDGTTTKKAKRSSGPSPVKDLNLRPSGEISFADFANEKAPRYANEQSLVAAVWLRDHGGISAITVDHIYTAYRAKGWKVPSNLSNHLQSVASKKGWLDTQEMDNIRVTVQGENHVLHDLPPTKSS